MYCNSLTREQCLIIYAEIMEENHVDTLRDMCRNDLFFLIYVIFKRKDINRDWLYTQIREVERNPNGYLDLWARDHYKSTIITYALTIQDIIKDPEITCGIFSHTKGIAKGFLGQIKRELEENSILKELFPEILYMNPQREAAKWSINEGLIVKRKTNPKESTVEAHGLVDGQPTSKHFKLRVYDDVVTKESVSTPEQIKNVTEAWELSLNLGMQGGFERYIGTRYHYNDTYRTILERGSAIPRIKTATHDGTMTGRSVFLPQEVLDKKRSDQGLYTFACHGKGTKVTMADWSQKNIEDVKVGDKVVGWTMSGDKFEKAKLCVTTVVEARSRMSSTVKSLMTNGQELVHTPDHKWWTGRVRETEGNNKRNLYSPLGFGNHSQEALCRVFDMGVVDAKLSQDMMLAAGYIAGMIDGEGACEHEVLQITQDVVLHPHICEKIEYCLNILGIPFSVLDRKKDNRQGLARVYNIKGGRNTRIRMLNLFGDYIAKRSSIERQCFTTRNFGIGSRIKLVSQQNNGVKEVFNIQTETGNYIANGFCSKNCQMLQNPSQDSAMGFSEDWLRYYDRLGNVSGWNFYVLVDPAGEKKKKNNGDPDYTVILVIALAPDKNYYLIDAVRDRMNLTERTKKLFHFVRKYKPIKVGYEKYGMQSDIEHIEYVMGQENYRFVITPLGGSVAKNDRIRMLVPIFEQGRVYIPRQLLFLTVENKLVDFVKEFIDKEYNPFPVGLHDDMLDDMARILDPELSALFPEIVHTPYPTITMANNTNMAQTEYDLFAS